MVSPSVTPSTCPVRVSAEARRGSSRAEDMQAMVGNMWMLGIAVTTVGKCA